MAGKLEPLAMEPPEVVEETEEAEGQTKPLKVPEDLLAMVKKLHKEGSLEPQIEDLINRINELQQAKKKSSEEMVEAQALWESLHRELDSLNGEKVHLEEVLSKKQEALGILQLHCQRKESGAQRVQVEEQLENLMSQHKDLWELHVSHPHCLQPKHFLSWLLCPHRLARCPPTAQPQLHGTVLVSFLPLTHLVSPSASTLNLVTSYHPALPRLASMARPVAVAFAEHSAYFLLT
ncbi:synaptonemal complex central element protein 1-like isoform X2 [Leopardus geoffroyi]|uniref:synaptonemal complex central element protein 1-like isoform X2 n=1 Tax=Leopardus geoffroyi TaxID=46844 RepID=UPI001E25E5A0|nr:synaptonemal complex central element protein 1-like isoform X2 [Leopardus geoffroyi]